MSKQPIPSELYDRDYFLSEACPGSDTFRAGRLPHLELHDAVLDLARIRPSEIVLDFGSGRGELTLLAAARARMAVGADYARAALEHAQRAKAAVATPVAARARFIRAAAGPLPLRSSSVDVVFMLDVIEHLSPDEVAATLGEFYRILRPGGRVIVHTPNRLDYDIAWPFWGYFVSAGVRVLTGRRPAIPRNKRTEAELRFHINEHSPRQLRKSLRGAGFERVRVMARTLLGGSRWSPRAMYVLVGQYLRPLSLIPPLSHVFNHSLLGVAQKLGKQVAESRS